MGALYAMPRAKRGARALELAILLSILTYAWLTLRLLLLLFSFLFFLVILITFLLFASVPCPPLPQCLSASAPPLVSLCFFVFPFFSPSRAAHTICHRVEMSEIFPSRMTLITRNDENDEDHTA